MAEVFLKEYVCKEAFGAESRKTIKLANAMKGIYWMV